MINTPPTTSVIEDTINEDGTYTVNAFASVEDIDGDSFSIEGEPNAQYGSVSIDENNLLTYIPSLNYNGPETITYTISDKNAFQEYISEFDVHKQKSILSKASKFEPDNSFIRAVLYKTVLYKDKVEIIICKEQLVKGLESIITGNALRDEAKAEPEELIKIIRISTTSKNGSVLIVNNAKNREININPFLVKIIAKGHYWNKQISESKFQTAKEIAEREKEHNVDYVKKAIRLHILSPKIVETILTGTQAEDLTVEKLCSIKTLDRSEQEKLLNFAT